MRDKERINRIINKLNTYWKQNPDLRLCQILGNFTAGKSDNYYVEDDYIEDKLDEQLGRKRVNDKMAVDYIAGRDDTNTEFKNFDKVILECSCADGCQLNVEKDEDIFYIIFKSNARNSTLNMFDTLKQKLKKIWYIVRGKDYIYFDIVADKKQFCKFVQRLNDLSK